MNRFDRDRDGVVNDVEIAALSPPRRWGRFGLRGPAIVLLWLTRNVKRIAVLVVGLAVLVVGAAMLVLPGPGVLMLIVGLAILATEFAWAERVLDRATANASRATARMTGARTGRLVLVLSGMTLVTIGVALVVFVERPVAGVGVLLAGVFGLAVLLPAVQARIARQRPSAAAQAESLTENQSEEELTERDGT